MKTTSPCFLRKNNGATVLELLIAASIALPLSLAFISLLRCASASLSIMFQRQHESQQTLTVFSHLQQIQEQIDSHPFALLPRVHRNGLITYADGSTNRISTTARLAPNPQSDAISYADLDLLAAHEVVHESSQNTGSRLLACPRHSGKFSAENYNSFLGIGADGFTELLGKIERGSGHCRLFTLRKTKSMVVEPDSGFELVHIHVIVPLRSVYTLYNDIEQNLRYVTHRGPSTVENQPLGANYPLLGFSLERLPKSAIYELSAHLRFRNNRSDNLSVMQRVERRSLYNYLLNPS